MSNGTNEQFSTPPDVQVEVKNFGPIEQGSIDLRPLTVFVGKSNTGKTYLATLIYALRGIMAEFVQVPLFIFHPDSLSNIRSDKSLSEDVDEGAFRDILDKLKDVERAFRFSDLPETARVAFQEAFEVLIAESWKNELIRCFDLESVSDLVSFFGHSNEMEVAMTVSENGQNLCHLVMKIAEVDVKVCARIEDIILIPKDRKEIYPGQLLSEPRFQKRRRSLFTIFEALEYVLVHSDSDLRMPAETYYLPAARSGIMQSHRVIASSLVGRSTRAGLERFPELPTFSGVVADFMQQLILYRGRRGSNDLLNEIAKYLEQDTLAGQIGAKEPAPGGYPEFVYRPHETEQDMSLNRTSSMVSELSPVVLFLRSGVSPGATLIIEEPEAHLHPAAQTQIAVALARMVRAGLRVMVTTHSDWLLQEFANLMREGELRERAGESENEEHLPSFLRPGEAGVWLFRSENETGSTVKEIPFDRTEGVEPPDYEDVAEELYNRAADLQNRLAEGADDE